MGCILRFNDSRYLALRGGGYLRGLGIKLGTIRLVGRTQDAI